MTAGSNLSVKNEFIVEKIANVNPCAFNGPTAGKLRLQAKIVDTYGISIRYARVASRGAVVGVVGGCCPCLSVSIFFLRPLCRPWPSPAAVQRTARFIFYYWYPVVSVYLLLDLSSVWSSCVVLMLVHQLDTSQD